MTSIKTPCIGICSTTSFGDLVCRGCKRYGFEVIQWNGYENSAKTAVLMRLEKLETQILHNKLKIVSEESLKQALRKLGIGFDESLAPWCWVHNLLAKGHHQVKSLAEFGLEALPQYSRYEVSELIKMIEVELLELSKAHYARYYQKL